MAKLNFFDFISNPTNTNLSTMLRGDTQLLVCNGVNPTWKLGSLVKDVGYSRVGNIAIANYVKSLHNFIQAEGTQKILMTMDDVADTNTELYYNSSGTWTEILLGANPAWALETGLEVEYADFSELGYCFLVGYSAVTGYADTLSLTGTTLSASTNLTNAPDAKYITRGLDRLFLANCKVGSDTYANRVYISPAVSAGSIGDWSYTDNFFTIPDEYITGISSNWERVIVFSLYSMYMYDSVGQTRKKVSNTGCSNHRTIQNINENMIWANGNNVYLSKGGYPQAIGGAVVDFIRGATMTSAFAVAVDQQYKLYVGNVTVNGVSYANCELTYDMPTESWFWREYYDTMTCYAKYNSSGTERQYMGSTTGAIWDKCKHTDSTLVYSDGKVTTTEGKPITAQFILRTNFGEPSVLKTIKKITAFAERAQGVKLTYRVIDMNTRVTCNPKSLGELHKYINTFTNVSDAGIIFEIEGTETSILPYFEFLGMVAEVTYAGNA